MDQSQRIVERYEREGLSVRLVKVAQAGHGGAAFFWGNHFQAARDFLQTQASGQNRQPQGDELP